MVFRRKRSDQADIIHSKLRHEDVKGPNKAKGKKSVYQEGKSSSSVHKIWIKFKVKDFRFKPEFYTTKGSIIPLYDTKSDEMHLNSLKACTLS